MVRKFQFVTAFLVCLAYFFITGRSANDGGPLDQKFVEGLAAYTGARITIPATGGNLADFYILKNDDATNSLLVYQDPISVGASGIPTPAVDSDAAWAMGAVSRLAPGESITFSTGGITVGVRCPDLGATTAVRCWAGLRN